jgi:hypothetical protein
MGTFKLILLLSALAMLGACSGQKQPAEQAFVQIQASIDPVSADLERYAPDEYEKLTDLVNQMKAKLNSGDYDAVLVLRQQTMTQLITTSSAAAKHKQEMTKELSGDWKALSAAVPKMIGEISTRIDALRDGNQKSSDISSATVTQAEAQLPSLSAGWTAIMSLSKAGNTDAAITKAQELKKRCAQIGAVIGLKFGD